MCPGIEKHATREGAEFTMMNKVDVNGLHAHHVYHFLKKAAGPPHIGWNFAAYYHFTGRSCAIPLECKTNGFG